MLKKLPWLAFHCGRHNYSLLWGATLCWGSTRKVVAEGQELYKHCLSIEFDPRAIQSLWYNLKHIVRVVLR
jgi:hypothetical protein